MSASVVKQAANKRTLFVRISTQRELISTQRELISTQRELISTQRELISTRNRGSGDSSVVRAPDS